MFGEENDRQIYDQEVEEARFLELMSKPTSDICDAVYECPDSCDCNGNVQDGTQEICDAMTLPLFNLLLIRMYRLPVGHGIVSKLT
jgi:hypothetical protein